MLNVGSGGGGYHIYTYIYISHVYPISIPLRFPNHSTLLFYVAIAGLTQGECLRRATWNSGAGRVADITDIIYTRW